MSSRGGGADNQPRGGNGGSQRGRGRGMDSRANDRDFPEGGAYGRGGGGGGRGSVSFVPQRARGGGGPTAAATEKQPSAGPQKLEVRSMKSSALPTVELPMSQPLLFGGSRDQALKVAVARVDRTAEERGADREALTARKAAITTALQSVRAMTPGTVGTQASILSNYFPVKSQLATSFIQYSVVLEPEVANPRVRREVVNSVLKIQAAKLGVQCPIYIGHIAFAPRSMHPANTKEVTLQFTGDAKAVGWRSKSVRVTLTHTRDIAPPKDGAISTEFYTVLSSILSDAFSTNLLKVGGKYYDMTGELSVGSAVTTQEVAGDRFKTLKVMQGLNFVLHPTEKGLLLNVDIAFRTTRDSTVLDHLKQIKRMERDPKQVEAMFKADVEGCMMATTYLAGGRRQSFKAVEVVFGMTPTSVIPGLQITFKKYMQEQYNITLTDDSQPLIMTVTKQLDRNGQPKKALYIPELCRFVGQSTRMRADTVLQQSLKQMCLVNSTTRFNSIQSMMDRFVPKISQALKDWGITIETKMLEVQGRILPQVKLTMGPRVLQQQEERRSWLLKSGLQLTSVPTAPKLWVCVKPVNISVEEMQLFLDTLMNSTINGLGCRWPAPTVVEYVGDRAPQRTLQNLMGALEEKVPKTAEFALVVLPDDNEAVYVSVKDVTLRQWRIPSQCVLRKNVINGRNVLNVASRVGAQMIVKQGGELWNTTEEALPNTLLCGIDYATGAKGEVVALVAVSTKRFQFVFEGSSPAKKTAIVSLLEKAMDAFKEQSNAAAANVVLFRAGMDEGDVPRIVDEEVLGVVDLCRKRKVSVCFLASLKRTHARFFNPPPGFVIDREVLPRAGFAFLLVPQVVNIGTATAMKFCVLANTIRALSADGGLLESVAFKLCHMFYGWWATTREPSIVMYATRRASLASKVDATAPLGPANHSGFIAF